MPRSVAANWKLEDAKARFSEMVRKAQAEGPQRVTVRGKPAVVVVDAEEYDRLVPAEASPVSFLGFMESLDLDALSLEREADYGRDEAL